MRSRRGLWLLSGALLGAAVVYAAAQNGASDAAELKTVERVELERYLGGWHEIARYPNWFERKCDSEITATYSLREDGKISVVNACRGADGKTREARGWARVADARSQAKLRVTFFWPFFGNYWVIDLGKDYEYAVVGEPKRKYLWILSREAKMSEEQYEAITARLKEKGYDAARLIRVEGTR